MTRALIETCLSEEIRVVRYEQPSSFAELSDHIRYAEVKDWCEEAVLPFLAGLDPDRNTVVGEDFGRTGDLSVFIPLQEQQSAKWRAIFHLELRNIPFQQQEQIFYYICDRCRVFRLRRPGRRGNGQYLASGHAEVRGKPHRPGHADRAVVSGEHVPVPGRLRGQVHHSGQGCRYDRGPPGLQGHPRRRQAAGNPHQRQRQQETPRGRRRCRSNGLVRRASGMGRADRIPVHRGQAGDLGAEHEHYMGQ